VQTFDFESAAYANFATPAAIENKLLTESYHFTNPTPQSNLAAAPYRRANQLGVRDFY